MKKIPRKHFEELQNGHQKDDFSFPLNMKITMQQVHDVKHWEFINNENTRMWVKELCEWGDTFKAND